MGLVGYATSDVVLEDVRVHKSDMLGKENMGFINAMKTLDGGRLGVSAQSIGLAQGCLDEAIKYSKERVQFGKPICKNQAIAFMLADMAINFSALTVAACDLSSSACRADLLLAVSRGLGIRRRHGDGGDKDGRCLLHDQRRRDLHVERRHGRRLGKSRELEDQQR